MVPSRGRRRPSSAGAADGGFTLVELLVVISILGILAAVAVFAVSSLGDRGTSAATAGDASVIATAEEAYCAQYGHYADIATLHDAGLLASTDSTYNAVGLGALGQCGTGPNSSYTIFGAGDDPRLTVGHGPTDIDVDPTTDTVYVLNLDDSSVSVIDGSTRAVTATVAVTPGLSVGDRLVVDAVDKVVYVTVGGLGGLVAIDATSHALLGPVTPGAGGLVPGADCVPVVDPSTGILYAWAADGDGRQYLLAYGADPTHVAPRVVDVSQGLPAGVTYASASSVALEQAPTVVDPGRALYQVGSVGGSRYWLGVDLATDGVTLTPFPASGSRTMADPSPLASTFAGIDPTTHAVSTIVQYASNPADSGNSVAVATLTDGTTAAAAITYPVLDDFVLPDGTGNPDYTHNLGVSSPAVTDPTTGDTLVWGPQDAGRDDSNGGPQDQVTVYDSSFHRIGTTGGTVGTAPDPSAAFTQPVVAQKVLVVSPTTHVAYGAQGYNATPSSGVGYGGILEFAVANPIPSAVHEGIRFAAVIVDPVTHAVYAVDHERGAVTVVG